MTERLQKIIARSGLSSRREAEKMILAGRVSVNDRVVREMGAKADIAVDAVRVDGVLIHPEAEKIYLMLHKPPGYVTTLNDPQKRPIVTDLLADVSARVFPVGRLDYDSEGLLLLTNDGDFAQRVLHPRFRIPKVYRVKVRGKLTAGDLRALRRGIKLEDGVFLPEDIRLLRANEKSTWLEMTLREGKNRIIRRAFSSLNHDVARLVRMRIGGLDLGDLQEGSHRPLTPRERKIIFPLPPLSKEKV